MNPDGNPDRLEQIRPLAQPPDIIDVRVVEEISSGAEPLADVWDRPEVTDPQPLQSPIPESSPAVVLSENSPVDNGAIREVNRPSSEDNWNVLLDEIGQELEPEAEIAVALSSKNIDRARVKSLLMREEAEIGADIENLKATRSDLQQDIADAQINFGKIVQNSLRQDSVEIADLEKRRQKLQISVEQLERRRERIEAEINKSFAGASQDIAIRLQGFKDYLVGSLQDLVIVAEEIEFPQPPTAQIRIQTPLNTSGTAPSTPKGQLSPQFAEPAFKATAGKVRASIERYRSAPDYYAPTWQLRRTLEAVHADKVSDWFFNKDGRGAVRSMGSRLQNILVAATAVSALRELYGDYLRTLVLANLPERLGDWRRGFQDCLGLSKPDFGGNGGIILFEDPDALVQKADRIVANKEMPLIIIDNSEGQISLSILQYPLWLAFAPDPDRPTDDFREFR
jgi:Protein of unknown function (DUF3086)